MLESFSEEDHILFSRVWMVIEAEIILDILNAVLQDVNFSFSPSISLLRKKKRYWWCPLECQVKGNFFFFF